MSTIRASIRPLVARRQALLLSRTTASRRPSAFLSPSSSLPRQSKGCVYSPSRRWLSDTTGTDDKTAKGETPKEEETEAKEEAAGEETTTPVEPPTVEEQLKAELEATKEKLLRSLAEQDNARRIAKRDVADARSFAIKSFAKSLLEVSDNLERALGAVPADSIKEEGSVLANLYEGIQLTEKGLNKAFESNGLVKFGEAGEDFDPNKHEALMEYVDPNSKPGTVGQIMKPGFMLSSRVLRPAEVGVIKEP